MRRPWPRRRKSKRVGNPSSTLRRTVIVAGIGWALAFALIGPLWRLQEYGDGSLFSYAVAAQDAWAFHWHNISGRLTAFVLTMLPGELYVGATGDAAGGIDIYGALFFIAPLIGLAATYAADRSRGRVIFLYACATAACACPLVFGFPTEMWIAQALFWPALALAHYARRSAFGFVLIAIVMLALVFSHAAAVVLALAILMSVALRGGRSFELRRAALAFVLCIAVWLTVKIAFPPDDYFESVLERAALHFFDPALLISPLMLTLTAAVALYLVLLAGLSRRISRAHIAAFVIVAVLLAIYWLVFDTSLHTQERYFMRTILFVLTLAFGGLATLQALDGEQRIEWPIPLVRFALDGLRSPAVAHAAAGVLVLVALVHGVETAKFVAAWTEYRGALRTLAMSSASDPALGDPRFVSADRIDARADRMSWNSTTPYLAVLLAPGLNPARLVIDPAGNYFWLTCVAAGRSASGAAHIPAESRELVRIFACAHRRR